MRQINKYLKLTIIIAISLCALFIVPQIVGLSLKYLDGQSHFINDTSDDVEFLLFTYDNYKTNQGTVKGPYFLKQNETKSLWEPYPICLYMIKSGKNFYISQTPSSEEPRIVLTVLQTSKPCPLDLKSWEPKTKWLCKGSKSGYEPCKLVR